MGEDTHSPTVGLVVPVADPSLPAWNEMLRRFHARPEAIEEPEAPHVDKCAGENPRGPASDNQAGSPEPCAEPRLSDEPDDALHGAHPDKRPNRTSRHRSESSVELGIAIQALQNAREGADALRPGMLQHQRDAVLCDPISQINLARRSLDAVELRWKRGGK